MKKRRFKFSNHRIDVQWNEAATAEACDVMVYEDIGKDPWTGSGLEAKDFKKVLDEIPRDRPLNIRVNSRGGDVYEGMGMLNMLKDWPKPVSTTIDGVAASTSSWAFMPNRNGDSVRAHRTSQMFIHDAISFGFGNAEELRKAADNLDKTSDQIAGLYADRTGKGNRTMRQMMKDETLLTGEEAEELGLVDELIDGKAVRNFMPKEITQMRDRISAILNSAAKGLGAANQNPPDPMKKKLIAMMNKHGVTELNGVKLSATMTDEQLNTITEEQLEAALTKLLTPATNNPAANPINSAAVSPEDFKKMQDDLKAMSEATNAAKKLRIENAVRKAIVEDRIPANAEEFWVGLAMQNEDTVLKNLNGMPPKPPGGDPVRVELKSESFADVQNFVLENGPRFRKKFLGPQAGNTSMTEEIRREIASRAWAVANALSKNREKILEAWNNNAIDSDLQRQVILQDMLEAYAIVLTRLQGFSVVYESVPLEGDDTIRVPYFPLQANAATSFDATAGYNTTRDWTENSRKITVGGDGNTATSGNNATANTAKDRKYIGIKFTSYDLRRQPYLNLVKLFTQAANKLAVDVFTDIVSRVVTAANFTTNTVKVAAGAFTADNVADLRNTGTGLYWPLMGRSLYLDHNYYTALLKSPDFKAYLAYGSTDPIQGGRIPNAYGYENIYEVPNLTNYSPAGENLSGWSTHRSAVGVATANIMPTEEVRALMTRFDIVVDPKTGISFAYRRFGDTTLDTTKEFVECSYGAAKFVDLALDRITTQ